MPSAWQVSATSEEGWHQAEVLTAAPDCNGDGLTVGRGQMQTRVDTCLVHRHTGTWLRKRKCRSAAANAPQTSARLRLPACPPHLALRRQGAGDHERHLLAQLGQVVGPVCRVAGVTALMASAMAGTRAAPAWYKQKRRAAVPACCAHRGRSSRTRRSCWPRGWSSRGRSCCRCRSSRTLQDQGRVGGRALSNVSDGDHLPVPAPAARGSSSRHAAGAHS